MANAGSACSGLRSPQSRYSSACWGVTSYVVSASGLRSGISTAVDSPRSPPQPPSPRTKIEERTVQSTSPPVVEPVETLRATPSCQITAALPLSQTSLIRVERIADPDVGSGAVTEI